MPRAHNYSAHLVWTGAQQGPAKTYADYSRAFSAEITGKPALTGSADPHFKGDPKALNPEDLLMIALSSCHMLSYLALAVGKGLQIIAYEDSAQGTMSIGGGTGHFTEVVLKPRVTIARGGDITIAKALHGDAHHSCFVANSVNFPVRNEPEIIIGG